MRPPRSLVVGVVLVVAALIAVPAAAAATAPALPTDGTHRSPTAAQSAPVDGAADATDANATADATDETAADGNATANATVSDHDDCEPVANGTRENPDGDPLGWEAGCWYDDGIDVDRSDGLNQTELDAVVARGMARVEQIRGIEFDHRTPVNVISRETFANRTAERFANVSTERRLHQNAKYEALFMVSERTDAVDVLEQNTASGTLGYYSSRQNRIIVVSENTTSPKMNEITLSQELYHSLQWNQFNVTAWDWSTRERHNANDGIIEGDGNYVDHLYQQRCEANWSCLLPGPSGSPPDRHVGILALRLQPYSDGPVFVRELREEGGWEAVNDIYETPPASTEQTIHTEKYGTDPPTEVNVTHTASNGWHVLDLSGGVDYAEFGEAGMYTMLWYPAFDTRNSDDPREIIPYNDFFTPPGDLDLYNYDHPHTAGWDGDKLYPYVNNASSESGETGYVWKSVWDSGNDASEFVTGYTQLLREFGAREVDGRLNTWRIPDGSEFGDAYYVNQTGDTVIIVNAPSVEALPDVRAGAAPELTPTPTPEPELTRTPTPTRTASPTAEPTPTPTDRPTEGTTAVPTTTSGSGPAPGALVTALAVALAALALARRRST